MSNGSTKFIPVFIAVYIHILPRLKPETIQILSVKLCTSSYNMLNSNRLFIGVVFYVLTTAGSRTHADIKPGFSLTPNANDEVSQFIIDSIGAKEKDRGREGERER